MKKRIAWILVSLLMASSIYFSFAGCQQKDEWKISAQVEAQCESEGYIVWENSQTGKTKKESMPALGHDYVLEGVFSPSCGQEGYSLYRCSRCGEEIQKDKVEGLEHAFVYKKTIEPSCTEVGYDLYECVNCHQEKQANFTNRKVHSYEKDSELSHGAALYICSSCKTEEIRAGSVLSDDGNFLNSDFQTAFGDAAAVGWEADGDGAQIVLGGVPSSGKCLEIRNSASSKGSVTSYAFQVIGGKGAYIYYDLKTVSAAALSSVGVEFFDEEFQPLSERATAEKERNDDIWQSYRSKLLAIPYAARYAAIVVGAEGEGDVSVMYDNVRLVYSRGPSIGKTEEDGNFYNSGFETSLSGKVVGWDAYKLSNEEAYLSDLVYDSTGVAVMKAYEGTSVLATKSLAPAFAGVKSSLLEVKSGVAYEVGVHTANYYATGAVRLGVEVYSDAEMKDLVYSDAVTTGKKDGNWTVLAVDLAVPDDGKYLRISLLAREGVAYWDGVKVYEYTAERMALRLDSLIAEGKIMQGAEYIGRKEFGLKGTDEQYLLRYYQAVKDLRERAGKILSREEIQSVIDEVNASPEKYFLETPVVNPGFEETADDKIIGWTSVGNNSNSSAEIAHDIVYDGNNSVKISKTDGDARRLVSDAIVVESSRTYILTAKAYCTSYENASAYLYAMFYKDEGLTEYVSGKIGRASINERWGSVSLVFTVPEGVNYLTVSIAETYEISIVTMYFDDLELKPLTEENFLSELTDRLRAFDRYQVRALLKARDFEKFGTMDANLEKYMFGFIEELEKDNLTLASLRRVIAAVNEDEAAYSRKIALDALSSVESIAAATNGVADMPESLDLFAQKYYTRSYFSYADSTNREYVEIQNGKLYAIKRPSKTRGDMRVKVVLNVYLHGVNVEKEIDFLIKKYQSEEEEAVCSVTFASIAGQNTREDAIASDLVLPSSFNGIQFSWSSSDESLVGSDGKVHRPAYVDGDAAAALTVSAGEYSKTFRLIVCSLNLEERERVEILNSDFENLSGDGVTNWYRYSDFGKFERTKSVVFQGEHSLRLHSVNDHNFTKVFCNGIFDVTENVRYNAQAAVYTEAGGAWPGIYLEFYNIQGVLIDFAIGEYEMEKLGRWQNVSVTYVAPVGAVSAKICLYTCAGDAYFDCVRFDVLPSVDNGSFSYGNACWTGGEVKEGAMLVKAGENALSRSVSENGVGYPVKGRQRYILSADVKGSDGRIVTEFLDEKKEKIGESCLDVTGGIDFTKQRYTFTPPSGTECMRIRLLTRGTETFFDNIEYYMMPFGTQVTDGGFENHRTPDSGWNITKGEIISENPLAGKKNLYLEAGGRATANRIPVWSGKSYAVGATVKTQDAQAGIELKFFNIWGDGLETKKLALPAANTAQTVLREIIAPVTSSYMTLTLCAEIGGAVFDEVFVNAVSSSLSNSQFENIYDALDGSGSFPYQWKTDGRLVVNSVGDHGLPDGVRAVSLMGSGEFSSAFMKIEQHIAYEGSIYASEISGEVRMSLRFYDENFSYISSSAPCPLIGDGWNKNTVYGVSPESAAYVSLAFSAENGNARLDKGAVYEKVRNIGNHTQMFLDEYMIESADNLSQEIHQAKQSEYFKYNSDDYAYEDLGGGFYGTVMYDEEEKLYKMWYMSRCTDVIGYGQNYSTSTDGIHWTNPIVSQYEYEGSLDNNFLAGRWYYHGISVFKDNAEPDPNKRYKIVYCHLSDEAYYVYAYSADGIHISEPVKFLDYRDVVRMTKDIDNGMYVVMAKCVINRRDQYVLTATDLSDLSHTVPILMNSAATPLDGMDCYCADSNDVAVYPMYDGYVGLSNVIKIEDPSGFMIGVTNVKLLYSRDLSEEWTRPTYESIIRDGDMGEYTYGFKGLSNTMFNVGDEIWLYASGGLSGQWKPQYQGSIIDRASFAMFICKWRKDGFVSLNSNGKGSLLTKEFIFDGDKLTVNFEGEGLKVELLDENGQVIEGFSREDCDTLTGDDVSASVAFKGSEDLSSLRGKTVRVRFVMDNVKLYSFGVSAR